MYIIIIGGGKIGYYLSKSLMGEGHEVLVIEKQREKCEKIVEDLGQVCLQGDGSETSVLAEAGTSRADLFISVTDADEDNLVACQMAKQKFGVTRTMALVHNPKNEAIFKSLGIDVTICDTTLIMEQVEQEVPTHPLIHLFSLSPSNLELVDVKIPPKARAIGKKIKDITLPANSYITLVIPHNEKPKLPTPEIELKAGDQIIAITPKPYEAELYNVFISQDEPLSKIARKIKL